MAPLSSELQVKVDEAKNRIKSFYERFGHNRVYVAFSGGKDSRAVLRLCRETYGDGLIVIHNGHEGESIGDVCGVLCVREPKAENVPKFLVSVDLKGQIDGTRRDEDKEVQFDGESIHRSRMTNWYTEQGVFGLAACYPLFDWTEEEVFAYLESPSKVY